MNLIQFLTPKGKRAVGAIEGGRAHQVSRATSVYALASEAAKRKIKLKALIKEKGLGKEIDPAEILAEGRMLPPIDHPDPSHLWITGTGLTHLGSASTRDAMHKSDQAAAEAAIEILPLFHAPSRAKSAIARERMCLVCSHFVSKESTGVFWDVPRRVYGPNRLRLRRLRGLGSGFAKGGAMPDRFEKFVHDENLKNFGKQLRDETDPARRAVLLDLIEEQKRRTRTTDSTEKQP
jgi:hypothetical protein